MREFAYETISKAWASKFLTSQDDSLVLATRPANSYGSRFVLGELNGHNRSGGFIFLRKMGVSDSRKASGPPGRSSRRAATPTIRSTHRMPGRTTSP